MSISINGLHNTNMIKHTLSAQIDENNSEDFQSILESAIESGTSEEIRKAAVEMEGFFIGAMMKEMRKTVPEPQGIFKRSSAEIMMTEMLDQQMAMDIAESGGIGLSDMLYEQLSKEANK